MRATTHLLRQRLREYHRIDEAQVIEQLIPLARFTPSEQQGIRERATPLVQTVRDSRLKSGGIDAFLTTYDLSSREGVVLMCLAEALLRIPDAATVDRLIRDKIGSTEWEKRLGTSHSTFVNAGTWALMLTGRIVNLDNEDRNLRGTLKRLIARTGEPVIRQAVITAMRILGKQFVMGRNIHEALERARSAEKAGYRHSYDMLGESARSSADALRYFESYRAAIRAIGDAAAGRPAYEAPSISIKLSALHPRYEVANEDRVRHELWPVVKELALRAKARNIGFTIDAEEVDRLEMSLDLIEALATDAELAGWNGLGLAVQAYQKRALPLIDWLTDLAYRADRRLMVRLCKGAYWDAEIKLAQERGLRDYPVFTRKASSDLSYLACARRLFAHPQAFYPAFATHNAHTLAAVAEIAISAGGSDEWEYQRLHGMGEELYDQIVGESKLGRACRVYAPVGSHEDLLAYLVRRLLENGANSSFVNRIADASLPIDALLKDPVDKTAALTVKRQTRIPLPRDLFGAERINSEGLDMNDKATLEDLRSSIEQSLRVSGRSGPAVAQHDLDADPRRFAGPAFHGDHLLRRAGLPGAEEAQGHQREAVEERRDLRAVGHHHGEEPRRLVQGAGHQGQAGGVRQIRGLDQGLLQRPLPGLHHRRLGAGLHPQQGGAQPRRLRGAARTDFQGTAGAGGAARRRRVVRHRQMGHLRPDRSRGIRHHPGQPGADEGQPRPGHPAPAGRRRGQRQELGLDRDWAARAVKAVGNYGEIFQRNVGKDSPLKLPRGANALWNKGGLLYAPPVR
jgi:RHH-type proline utilization regulon transcriptional repressor/proline dehydrogenase/delta 1-pyrroline-5-carboxylate dehydrogenase